MLDEEIGGDYEHYPEDQQRSMASDLMQKVIRKLKKRTTTEICGKTLFGSSEYWMIFRLHYNKPKYAKQGFQRLIGRSKMKTADNGVITAELVYKLDTKTETVVS